MNLKYQKLSVILPTYNSGGKIIQALESLSNQTLDQTYAYEVLIIDNNSNDDTKVVVENFIKNHPKVFKYHFQSKQGKGNALNMGIEEAKGEVMAITDDDCVIDSRWVNNILDTFNRKNIDLLTGKIIAVFQEKLPSWLDPHLLHAPFCNINAGDEYFENDEHRLSYAGANMAFTKKGVEQFGNFTFVFGRGEDVVFFNSWVQNGAKFGYAPHMVVKHINYPNRVTKDYVKKWYLLAGNGQGMTLKNNGLNKVRSLFGVPWWIYKKMIVNTFNVFRFYFTQPARSYFYRTRIYHCMGTFGYIWGNGKVKNMNLR